MTLSGRFPLLAPLALLGALALAACTGSSEGTPTIEAPSATAPAPSEVTRTPEVTATATEVATNSPSVAVPYAVAFDRGEPIDADRAVIFVDPNSGTATAWILPDNALPGPIVSPDGGSVFWLSRTLVTPAGRAALADDLFAELAPHLTAVQRDQVRAQLDAIAATPGDDEASGLPIAAEIVATIRSELPRDLASSLKDRLAAIASPPPSGLRWHLLRTADGSDRVLDVTSPPLAIDPTSGAFVANTVASDAGASGPAIFDASGEPIGELPAHSAHYGAAFSPDGALAYVGSDVESSGAGGALSLRIQPSLGTDPIAVLVDTSGQGRLRLVWSPDGERLALVTEDRVRIFAGDGQPIWEAAGAFQGNPRWSSLGYLHVHGVAQLGPDDDRLFPYADIFDPNGELHFRVRWLGTCAGDPWLPDGSGLHDGRHLVLITGETHDAGVETADNEVSPLQPDEVTLRWRRDDDGTWQLDRVHAEELEPLVMLESGLRRALLETRWTVDGRYVFSTALPDTFGGCGEGWSAPVEAPTVEQPSS